MTGFVLYMATAPGGKRYVGITRRSLETRWLEHAREARGKRSDRALLNAIRKYGPNSFALAELASADHWRALCALEREAIARYGTFAPGGYNLTLGGDGFTGHHGPETRAKMRAAHIGTVRTSEHRRKLSAALMGKRHEPEIIQKIKDTKRARPLTPGELAKLARMHAGNIGRIPSAEHRAKISAAHRGRPKLALRGVPLSPERRAKISAANRGKSLSEAHRAKLRAAWARRRSGDNQQELFNG